MRQSITCGLCLPAWLVSIEGAMFGTVKLRLDNMTTLDFDRGT